MWKSETRDAFNAGRGISFRHAAERFPSPIGTTPCASKAMTRPMPDRDEGAVVLEGGPRGFEADHWDAEPPDVRSRWTQRPLMQKQRLLRVIEASADESMLSEIHRQQRHIFALTHEYQILAMRDRDNKQLLSLLERIVDAVLANFSTEEAVLAELEP